MEGPNKPLKTFRGSSLARCLALSLTSGLLFCSGFFVPVLGTVGFLFSPTPLALLGVRENKTWMALGLLLMGMFLLALEPMIALYFLLMEGLLCVGLAFPPGHLEKGSDALFLCSTVSVASKVLYMTADVILLGYNPFIMKPDALRSVFMQMYLGLLAQDVQSATALKESMEQILALAPYMVPSLIVTWSMLDSYLNYRLCEAIQRGRSVVFPPSPPFGMWRFPKSILWALLVAFLLPLLTESEGWSVTTMLEVNLKFLVNVFFFLQGLSLIWWWLLRRKVNFLLRVFIIALLTLPILGLWVIGLGIGDICFDFRTLRERSGKGR
ncbi:MAG: YybS family protein [Synergistaceae bacterium]|jgi:uncharacterized protein YybS (DUF2232 family)|nr:YybS family protein [Synergistaceae bacterium]